MYMAPWWVGWTVGLTILAGGVAMIGRQFQQPPPPAMPYARGQCREPLVWAPVWKSAPAAVQAKGETWKLEGRAILGTQVCQPGILSIKADREGPGAPTISVTLDGSRVAELRVKQPQEFKVKISHAGNLQIGYFNDYYKSEVRLIEFRNMRLKSHKCPFITDVVIPSEKGGGWAKDARIGTLISNLPAIIRPCEAGELSFVVRGESAQGQEPVLSITQGNQVLFEGKIPSNRSTQTLTVSAKPLQMRLLNPYARELADRNLIVTPQWRRAGDNP